MLETLSLAVECMALACAIVGVVATVIILFSLPRILSGSDRRKQ